uniref:kelch-like protein 1 n=1 Tax=Styela clava TaxID=7725 RepID=UPI00193A8BE4|nr:kelch-like protein 1 [Styela clava]
MEGFPATRQIEKDKDRCDVLFKVGSDESWLIRICEIAAPFEKLGDLLHVATLLQLDEVCSGIVELLETNLSPESIKIQLIIMRRKSLSLCHVIGTAQNNESDSDKSKFHSTAQVDIFSCRKRKVEISLRFVNCQTFFLTTLDVSRKQVRTALSKEFIGSVENDMRGITVPHNRFDPKKGKSDITAVERYDPNSNIWTSNISQPIEAPGLAVFQNKIYCFGGYYFGQFLNIVNQLDAEADVWKTVGHMHVAKSYTAVVTVGESIYILGRLVEGLESIKAVWRFDPISNNWQSLSPMLTSRYSFNAFAIQGYIYAVGGWDSSDSLEKYNIAEDKWELIETPERMELDVMNSVKIKLKK